MLQNLSVILVRPRFPENIGMTARAMANMGAGDLVLVAPERWEREKALPLATVQGQPILDSLRLADDLQQALAPFSLAVGTTARIGGLRRGLLSPEKSAVLLRAACREGGRAALVFGPEDRGLSNEESFLCTHLATIDTAGASSLNLAQAVLVMLYECLRADLALPFAPNAPGARSASDASGTSGVRDEQRRVRRKARSAESRRATLAEEQRLLAALSETLIAVDHLPADNPSHFMQPLRRFLRKSRLRRHEFDMLMGICRQLQLKIGK